MRWVATHLKDDLFIEECRMPMGRHVGLDKIGGRYLVAGDAKGKRLD